MATFSLESLKVKCNQAFPAAGGWAYVTLLSGDLALGVEYTANAATNELTTASAHNLVTGSRIRLVSGVLPTPTVANADYSVIFVSATTFKLAASLFNAVAGIEIDLSDSGSGLLTFTEQPLMPTDPLSVLVNKEIVHPSWTSRLLLDNLGAAVAANGAAETPAKNIVITNDGVIDLSFRYYLFIEDFAAGTAVLGSVPAAGYALETQPNLVTIAVGEPPRSVFMKLLARNLL
jgi:hypothetical protein